MQNTQKPLPKSETDRPRIVPLGTVEALTGHDSQGNMSDGGGTSSKYKDPGRGAGE